MSNARAALDELSGDGDGANRVPKQRIEVRRAETTLAPRWPVLLDDRGAPASLEDLVAAQVYGGLFARGDEWHLNRTGAEPARIALEAARIFMAERRRHLELTRKAGR